MHHSLALTSDGKIYAFGRADYGQLGLPDVNNKAGDCVGVPTEVTIPPPVCFIYYNCYFCCFSSSHNLFSFNQSGSNTPVFVDSISCGANHNLAVVKNEVYTWGYGDMLALGHGVEKDESLPRVSLIIIILVIIVSFIF